MKKVLSLLFVVLLSGTFLTGCMISRRSHSDSSSDYPVSKTLLDIVEPGVTTKEWVIDTFGEPDRERYLQEGKEVLVYENTKHKSSHFTIFLLFDSHSSEDVKEIVSFKIKDGIVDSYSVN